MFLEQQQTMVLLAASWPRVCASNPMAVIPVFHSGFEALRLLDNGCSRQLFRDSYLDPLKRSIFPVGQSLLILRSQTLFRFTELYLKF